MFEPADVSWPRVNIDYHVEFDGRYYSVPHPLVGERVELRATSSTVEILHGGQRVASHLRSFRPKGAAVTCEAHRPLAHRDYAQAVAAGARAIGGEAAAAVLDLERERRRLERQADPRALRTGMPRHVRQRFLEHAVNVDRHVIRHRPRRAQARATT